MLRALTAATRRSLPDARAKEPETDGNKILDKLRHNTKTKKTDGPQGTPEPTPNKYSTIRLEPTRDPRAAQQTDPDPQEGDDWVEILRQRKLQLRSRPLPIYIKDLKSAS